MNSSFYSTSFQQCYTCNLQKNPLKYPKERKKDKDCSQWSQTTRAKSKAVSLAHMSQEFLLLKKKGVEITNDQKKKKQVKLLSRNLLGNSSYCREKSEGYVCMRDFKPIVFIYIDIDVGR